MLLLFVQDALDGVEGEEKLKYMCECSLIKDIFRRVVSDFTVYEVAN